MKIDLTYRFLVFLLTAGALGTFLRFLAMRYIVFKLGDTIPTATLVVNVLGAFVAGFLFVILKDRSHILAPYAPIVLIGFLGAFTTFSTFALECAVYIQDGAYMKAFLNFAIQNGTGIIAALVGIYLGLLCAR